MNGRRVIPRRWRLSPIQTGLAVAVALWAIWMVVQPRYHRRERIQAVANLYVEQQLLLNESAAKKPSENRWLEFFKARVRALSELGPASHQDIDRLCALTRDFEMIYLLGRTATSDDQIPDYHAAMVIPPMTFNTPIPKHTNQAGIIWVPNAHEILSQATANLTETLIKIASK